MVQRRRWLQVFLLVLVVVVLVAVEQCPATDAAATTTTSSSSTTTTQQQQQQQQNYRTYPKRHRDEAAVIEWGHSAIISAIDATVAYFGPQTSDAAVFEVETSPIIADPIDGILFANPETREGNAKTVSLLRNAKEVHGNVVVMTDAATTSSDNDMNSNNNNNNSSNSSNTNNNNDNDDDTPLLSCLDLAIIAQNSKAVALLIVHINEDRPDNAPRCTIPPGREAEAALIDIPIVTISLSSIDVFTSATITDDTKPEDIINHGMPERIRLYAGGERPFFEDIETIEPTVYMIHNLLTLSECQTMIDDANLQTFRPIRGPQSAATATATATTASTQQQAPQIGNPLIEYMTDTAPYTNIDRTVLHPGFFQSLGMKAIDDRIEQVTGFPVNQFSEWVIDRLSINSAIHPHYDNSYIPNHLIPFATITVFLNDLLTESSNAEGGQIVYPSISNRGRSGLDDSTDPIQIQPTQGLGVVHHNTNEKQSLEIYALHGLLPITAATVTTRNGTDPSTPGPYLYIARKYILPVPISKIRRYTVPVYLLLFGETGIIMNTIVTNWYTFCMDQFGVENGTIYFDYSLVGIPIFIICMIVAMIAYQIYKHYFQSPPVLLVPTAPTTTNVSKSSSSSTATTTKKHSNDTKGKSTANSNTASSGKKNGTKKKN